jgi:CHAT domain-containing protein
MILLLALPILLQSPNGVDSVRALVHARPDTTLIERVRRHPDDAREALRLLLVAGADGGNLVPAERLADAYAIAWRDSFFVRQVARFRGLSVDGRRTKIRVDSLRRAGNEALGTDGVVPAVRLWRESLRHAELIADSAGMAAALGNIGAGFYRAEQYDSGQIYLSRSRHLAETIGDHRTAGNAVGTLGSMSKDLGNLREAMALYTRAGEVRELSGDARGLAADKNNMGLIAEELGDLAAARAAYEAALVMNRSAGRAGPTAANLENLGNVASIEGKYGESEARYREALAIHRETGSRFEAAQVIHNLGLLAMRRGDYRSAITRLGEAVAIYRRTGPAADEVAGRLDLANARAAAGDLQGARTELRAAETRSGSTSSAAFALARADLAVQFNRLAEAERQYARAGTLARRAGDDGTRAAAQQGLGVVLLMRESYPRAIAALELAQRAQAAAGDRRATALTRLLLGHALRETGDTAAARRALTQALDTLSRLGDAAGEAAALSAFAELEADGALPLAAESLYQRGMARLGDRAAPGVAWQLHAGLGRLLRRRGALSEAAREFQTSIAQIERVSAGLTVEERRTAFLADKWDVYVELALVEQQRGHVQIAFEASERLRARQMLDMLARGRVEVTAPGEQDPTAREQDLRRRIDELTRHVEAAAESASDLRGPALLEGASIGREALARAQDAYAELLIELREANPAYAALVRGEVASVSEVMRALTEGQVLLEYLLGDSTTLVFVITSDTVVSLDLNVSRRALAALIDFARGTVASPREGGARRAWRAPMLRLYQQLIAPVQQTGLLTGKNRLLIAPHAELHYLPFAALLEPGATGQPLVTRYVLQYVPSAAVWLRLRSRPAPPTRGDALALAPRAAALPGSQAEVEAIGRIHGARARVLIGASATERAFRAFAPEQGIVHLATYGVLNKHNPLFSHVELRAGGGEDGRLEVHEVFGLTLRARLLVLSACQTGLGAGALGDVPPGDDWVGLVQAFLFSGASNVLATLWPVEDIATARLMERFYTELAAGRSESEALAEAQRGAERGRGTAHPFYWAGFALVTGR